MHYLCILSDLLKEINQKSYVLKIDDVFYELGYETFYENE